MKTLLFSTAAMFCLGAASIGAQNENSAQDSVAQWKQLQKKSPSDDAIRMQLARLCLRSGEYETVIGLYNKRFDEKQCTPDEYKLYAVARMQSYEHMVITAKLFSKIGRAHV